MKQSGAAITAALLALVTDPSMSAAQRESSNQQVVSPDAEADRKPVKTEKSWSYRDLD